MKLDHTLFNQLMNTYQISPIMMDFSRPEIDTEYIWNRKKKKGCHINGKKYAVVRIKGDSRFLIFVDVSDFDEFARKYFFEKTRMVDWMVWEKDQRNKVNKGRKFKIKLPVITVEKR